MRTDHVEGPLHILLVGNKGQPYLTSYICSFSIFLTIFLSFTLVKEGNESMMDHLERRRILVALASYWCLHMIMQHVFDMQTLALNEEWKTALILSISLRVWRWMIVVCGHLRELKPHAHTPHVVIIVIIVINAMLTLYYSIMSYYINYFLSHIQVNDTNFSTSHAIWLPQGWYYGV